VFNPAIKLYIVIIPIPSEVFNPAIKLYKEK
jgi:hypothetical protein